MQATMAKPKGPGRPPKHENPDDDGRTGVSTTVRLSPSIRAMIPQFQAMFRKKHDVRLSMTDVVEAGLMKLFREHGMVTDEADGGTLA